MHAFAIANLVDLRHVQRLLRIELRLGAGNQELICNHVVDGRQTGGGWQTQIGNLDWCGPVAQDIGACTGCLALQIHQDVDFVGPDKAGGLFITELVNAEEMVHSLFDTLAGGRAIFRTPAKTIDLKGLSVVQLEQLDRQQGNRVQTEVR